MKIVAKTDIGNQRSENQDNYRAGRQPDETVWAIVCDGMGGAQGGRLASGLAAAQLEESFVSGIDHAKDSSAVRKFMFDSIDAANILIYDKAQQTPTARGMGTTLVCAVARGDLLQYAHVGDSRLYLLREDTICQLTKDHSMVQELVEQGQITVEEANIHPNKNLITRALGVSSAVDVDYAEHELMLHDKVLLCTDGLSNYVTDAEIAEVLMHTPFYDIADVLVRKALDAGGMDNITVLVVENEPVEETCG
ncbi:MAG: Stp1/IreP family PP2C-type Ser/Thr phosphatase [Ruthenibacterium sp.]